MRGFFVFGLRLVLIAFNKPYGVICQFSASGDRPTLKDFISVPDVYPAGRLDTDSEGLLLLTDDGVLQARIASPKQKLPKTYWAQVEGAPSDSDLERLKAPLDLGDFVSLPAANVQIRKDLDVSERSPPIRYRASIPTTWIQLSLIEGKNRQVRRMTAKIGFPTLRLLRVAIGPISLETLKLAPGEWTEIDPEALRSPVHRPGRRPS